MNTLQNTSSPTWLAAALAVLLSAALASAPAAEIFKANNNNALNLGASWITNSPPNPNVPGPGDLATWDAAITTAANRTNLLGADLSWGGLRVASPGGTGAINIRSGNTLSLGALGIIMTNANRILVLSNNIILDASQTWGGADTRNIFVYGQLSGAAGNTLTKTGSNRVDLAAANSFAGDVVAAAGQLRLVHPQALGNCLNVRMDTSIVGSDATSGTQLALGTNVAPSGVTLTMTGTTNGGDYRTTLMCAGTTAGFSSGWNGPIVVTGDGSVQFNNNNAANSLIIAGNLTASNFSGTVRSRGGGSNAFLGTITIPAGSFVKHEAGPLYLALAGNDWTSTAINNGPLIIGADNTLPPATVITFGNTANSGVLDLNGHNQQIGGLATSGTGTVNKIYNGSTTTDATLTYAGTGPTTFTGSIDDNSSPSPGTPKLNLTVSSGALTLLPAAWHSTYSGTTTIKNGASLTLRSDHAGAGSLVVEDGATFGLRLASPGSSLSLATASLGTASGCIVNLDLGTLGNPLAAPITAGSLSANGTVTINVAGVGLVAGQFPLIAHSGSIGGAGFAAFSLGPLPSGVVSAYLSNNLTSVDLVITLAAGLKVWTGANGSDWDIGTTANWFNLATAQPDTYGENVLTGDLVFFDGTSSSQTVNVTTAVKPLVAVFSNSLPYTVNGPGSIYGSGSLVKGSYDTLTLNLANTFSGGCTHYEGVLQAGNDNALGVGPVTLPTPGAVLSSASTASRTLPNNLNLLSSVTLGDPLNSGLLTFTGGVNLGNATRDVTCNSDVVWTGASTNGRLNKLGTGTLTLKGTVIYNGIAEVRNGTMILDGATVTNNNAFRPDTDQPNGLARLVITNGTIFILTAPNANLRAGNDGNTLGTNILDIAATAIMPAATSPDGRILAGAGSALGIVNLLPGGDAEVLSVEHAGTNASQFNFDGGLLRARTNNPAFIQGLTEVYVRNGGAFIDTAGWEVTASQVLLAGGTGGLTKSGAGTLTLTGTNTYTGTTTVAAGRLGMTAAHQGGGPIVVAAAATLGIPSGVGGPTLAASSLTLGTSGTSRLDFDFGASPNPTLPVVNGGTVTANGTVKVSFLGTGITPGVIPLLKYSGTIGGAGFAAFNLDAIPRGVVATLNNNTGTSTIELVISAVHKLLWTGATDGNWDIFTTTNWTLGGVSAVYIDGDAPLFDDTATGSTTINILASVSPRSVTLNNAANPYTLQGSGSIDGPAVLTKTGSGLVTLSTPNTYSGLTTISAGQLKLGANNILPDGPGKSGLLLNGTLDLAGFTDAVNGLDGAGVVDNSAPGGASLTVGNNNASSSFSGTLQNIGGPLALVKTGSGTLQLSGANSHSGGTTLSAGTVAVASSTTLGTGPVTMAGGTLALPGPVTVTNLLRFSANNSRFTNQAASGTMVFNGGMDFLGGNLYLYFDNDTTFAGPLATTGGIERKFGLTTLTLQGLTGDMTGNLEIREGDVIYDGGAITKSQSGIRLVCMVTNGLSHFVITNGTSIQMIGTGQNLRVGSSSPNGEPSATNIASISGTLAWTPGNSAGAVQIGANAALCELNLLPGGVLKIRNVTPQQTAGVSRWNFDGGILSPIANTATFLGGLSEAYVKSRGAIIDTEGYEVAISQALLNGGGGGGLTKLGAGTLRLYGVNTYTGSTVVSNGVLGGTGVIVGPVIVRAGAGLSPGASIGTLTIASTLALEPASTTFVEVDASLGTADLVQGLTSVAYGGTLNVSNLNGTLALGQTFPIFNASTRTGTFNLIEPAPGPGLAWSFDPATGILSVVVGLPSTPTNLGYTVSGSTLQLSWPPSYLGWIAQSNSVGLAAPTQWFDVPGSGTSTQLNITINPAQTNVFYRLRYP